MSLIFLHPWWHLIKCNHIQLNNSILNHYHLFAVVKWKHIPRKKIQLAFVFLFSSPNCFWANNQGGSQLVTCITLSLGVFPGPDPIPLTSLRLPSHLRKRWRGRPCIEIRRFVSWRNNERSCNFFFLSCNFFFWKWWVLSAFFSKICFWRFLKKRSYRKSVHEMVKHTPPLQKIYTLLWFEISPEENSRRQDKASLVVAAGAAAAVVV